MRVLVGGTFKIITATSRSQENAREQRRVMISQLNQNNDAVRQIIMNIHNSRNKIELKPKLSEINVFKR